MPHSIPQHSSATQLNAPRGERDASPKLEDLLGTSAHGGSLSDLLLGDHVPEAGPVNFGRGLAQSGLFVPKDAGEWVCLMLKATDEDRVAFFQQIPGAPKHLEVIEALNVRAMLVTLVQEFRTDVWTSLDGHIPYWLANYEVVDVVRVADSTVAFDYLSKHHPRILQTTVGIVPNEADGGAKGPEQWHITAQTVDGASHDRSYEGTPRSTALARRLGEVWPKYTDEAILAEGEERKRTGSGGFAKAQGTAPWVRPRYLTGGERFAIFLEQQVGRRLGRWLWNHVDELKAYREGDDAPWQAITHPEDPSEYSGSNQWLGRFFIKQVLSSVEKNGTAAGGGSKEIDRQLLNHPILSNDELFHRLVPDNGASVSDMPGLNNPGQMNRLLSDQQTSGCMMNLLRRVCKRDRGQRAKDMTPYPKLGWNAARVLAMQGGINQTQLPGGLVEASMLGGDNAILNRLLETSAGTELIREALTGPTAGPTLQFMGKRVGWRSLGQKIRKSPAWVDWRDDCGNTIAHWLAYGYNESENRPAIKAHESLASRFPSLMTVTNDQGYTPTDFMPKDHANRIAERMIQKSGRRTAEQKRAAPATRKRSL